MNKPKYCPLCSGSLEIKNNLLFCTKGNCGYSRIAHEKIMKAYSSKEKFEPSNNITNVNKCFCPSCCEIMLMDRDEKKYFCQDCNISFSTGVLYNLLKYCGHL